MIIRSLLMVGTGMVSALLASSAFAAEGGAEAPKVGLEYRGGLMYSNQEWMGEDATSTTGINLERANLTVNGSAGKGMEYRVRYSVLSNSLEYGYFSQDLGMFTMLVGRSKVKQGGWDVRANGTWILNESDATHYLALNKYSDMIAFEFDVAGKLTLQLMNDVAGRVRQPAYVLEWLGSFGGISPLVQFGMYDLNKNMFFDAGVKYKQGDLDVEFDYYANIINTDIGDDTVTRTISNIHLHGEYAVGGYTPFAKVDMFNVVDSGSVADVDIEDGKTNTGATADGFEIDDNSTRVTVGSWCDHFGEHYRPYAAMYWNMAKFQDPDDAAKEESRSNMALTLGVAGKF